MKKVTSASMSSLTPEQQKDCFVEMFRGMHQKVPVGKNKELQICPVENGLLALRVGDQRNLFYFHKNENEKNLITQAVRMCVSEYSFNTERVERCADVQNKNGTLAQEVKNLFDHYALNFQFPWKVGQSGTALISKDHKTVLISQNHKCLEVLAAISLSEIQKTPVSIL